MKNIVCILISFILFSLTGFSSVVQDNQPGEVKQVMKKVADWQIVQPKSFYVSLKGNDNNPGTVKQPFRTIQKAIDESAEIEVDFILIKGGVYELDAPLVFKPEHSRTRRTDLKNKKIMVMKR